ncbi:MAG: glutamate--tRNA ligase family protein, partial [Trueperaceae bacterium]
YELAVVVDDAAEVIAEEVRGYDLVHATGTHRAIQRALGLPSPGYAHVPLLHGPDGERLAKRRGDLTLATLREAGVAPERVVGLLAWTLGLSCDRREFRAADLIEAGGGAVASRTPGRLHDDDLAWLRQGSRP